jgi:N-acetylmuramoyl-L-alanine amidase
MGTILVGDRQVEVGGPTARSIDLQFVPGMPATRPRGSKPDLCVWHWSGGEGEAATVARTLRKRKLSVHFVIDRDGVVHQFADPALVQCGHAGIVNARSVGVEIVNYGIRRARRLWTVPKKGVDRETDTVKIHGKVWTVAHFYPQQTLAAKRLAEALTVSLGIMPLVPLNGGAQWVVDHALTPDQLRAFKGHVGHYHVTDQKQDPGVELIHDLWKHLWRLHPMEPVS